MGEGEQLTRCFQPFNLGLWIWEHLGIENEITPMESSQPKAIEMEYFNRYISCLHAFEERINCLFIVICGEAGA
jgi:hypothetical protein